MKAEQNKAVCRTSFGFGLGDASGATAQRKVIDPKHLSLLTVTRVYCSKSEQQQLPFITSLCHTDM